LYTNINRAKPSNEYSYLPRPLVCLYHLTYFRKWGHVFTKSLIKSTSESDTKRRKQTIHSCERARNCWRIEMGFWKIIHHKRSLDNIYHHSDCQEITMGIGPTIGSAKSIWHS